MLLNNLISLNLNNIKNGVVGIQICNDDFKDNKINYSTVGSLRNNDMRYFMIKISNSKLNLKIEEQTLMDIFSFSTFIKLCSKTNIILSYRDTFEDCCLLIPYEK